MGNLSVAVIGAGGKMGMRVSRNLQKTDWDVRYAERGEAGAQRNREAGRTIVSNEEAVDGADVVIFAVPDTALHAVTSDIVPSMKSDSVVLTLDPAAAYANQLCMRDDLTYVVCHPTHPSVFLERHTEEEWADTFGGVAAPQNSVAAMYTESAKWKPIAEKVISTIFAPVIKVYWASVHDLAVLEPTVNETVGCMIGQFLKDVLDTAVEKTDMDEETVKAMFYGHIYIALTNALRGSNPFSDACLLAMEDGRKTVIKDDWKDIFNDDELDRVVAKMLKLDKIEH